MFNLSYGVNFWVSCASGNVYMMIVSVSMMGMVVKKMTIDNDIDDNGGDKLRQAAAVQLCQYFMS